MGYDLHIKNRPSNPDAAPTPISLEKWKEAVRSVEGLRLMNPANLADLPIREGDVEMYFPEQNKWIRVFRWHTNGSASFSADHYNAQRATFPDEDYPPVWDSAVALARSLDAVISGDDNEIYDLDTGEPTNA